MGAGQVVDASAFSSKETGAGDGLKVRIQANANGTHLASFTPEASGNGAYGAGDILTFSGMSGSLMPDAAQATTLLYNISAMGNRTYSGDAVDKNDNIIVGKESSDFLRRSRPKLR